MRIQNLHPGGWAANCYLVSSGSDAIVIDPSCPAGDITAALARDGLTLHAILLTHGHFDHLLAVDDLREATAAPLCLHRGDADFLADPEKSCYAPLLGRDVRHREAERQLSGGEELTFGALTLTVLHTPGHTGGCVCYRVASHSGDALFCGDTLFAEGYGRTDLPGGDFSALRRSLIRLAAWRHEAMTIYPGHGEPAGIGDAIAALGL